MDVEIRNRHGATLGQGRLKEEIALAIRKNDKVVFPFVNGCWVIKDRHLLIRKIDGGANITFIVESRDGDPIRSSMDHEVDV